MMFNINLIPFQLLLFTARLVFTISNQIDYSVCSHRTCMGLGSANDCVRDKSCDILLSGNFVNNDGLAQFEINAAPKQTHISKWYSMAFSDDISMGDDSVTDCFIDSKGVVSVLASFNDGQDNSMDSESNKYLRDISASYENGIITCKWKRERKSVNRGKSFDLLANKYYILLAFGNLRDDSGRKHYHSHENRLRSQERIDLKNVGIAVSADMTYLIRIHGSLMVIAWIGIVSISILLARHYKNVWVSSTLCGVKVWFAFHRGLMLLALTLMFIAQTCIFYYLGDYRIGSHQLLGSLAFLMAILQPIGALFRPEPEANNRWIFNWMHWFGGNTAHITAIVTIFLATNLDLADLPQYFLWTMISFIVFHVITHIALQMHSCVMHKRNFRLTSENVDIALQDLNHGGEDIRVRRDSPGSGFRRFVLGFYVLIVIIFVAILVVFITVPKDKLDMLTID